MATHREVSPLGAVGRGAVAGVAATAALTAYQTAVAKARDAEPSTAPAEVAKRVIRGPLQRDVSDDKTMLLNNAMHWTYGTSWGIPLAIVQASARARAPRAGLVFGGVVWAASLVELPLMKLAPPVWKQPPGEVALDASYHLAYGLAAATALRGLGI